MAKYNLYVEDVSVEAVFNKLGGVEGARALLRGELIVTEPPRSWREENGVITFNVTSDGTSGPEWITLLEGNGSRVGCHAKQVLLSPDFTPTNGVTTEVAVLKGMLFTNDDRITKKIRAEADQRKLFKLNAEVACLIRKKFTDGEIKAMGLLYIVVMHEPINDSDGDLSLLSVDRDRGGRWLIACRGKSGDRWDRDRGFAFAVAKNIYGGGATY